MCLTAISQTQPLTSVVATACFCLSPNSNTGDIANTSKATLPGIKTFSAFVYN